MKIGIALGGGGAKGFAHIGVLKTLTAAGIDCDIVAGTSIGALIGALYAEDSLLKVEKEAIKIKLTDIPILLSPTWSRQGFFSGKNVLQKLDSYISSKLIEELPKPYAAVCVDLMNSSIKTFTSGDIRQAIRASIAIPAVFTPVIIDDKILIDGAVLEPVPVDAARMLGADFVIAVDLFGNDEPVEFNKEKTPLAEWFHSLNEQRQPIPNMIEIIERTLAINQRSRTEERLKYSKPDIIIRPALSNIGLLDFHEGKNGINMGVRATNDIIPKLRAMIS
jgi:NTE family protein